MPPPSRTWTSRSPGVYVGTLPAVRHLVGLAAKARVARAARVAAAAVASPRSLTSVRSLQMGSRQQPRSLMR